MVLFHTFGIEEFLALHRSPRPMITKMYNCETLKRLNPNVKDIPLGAFVKTDDNVRYVAEPLYNPPWADPLFSERNTPVNDFNEGQIIRYELAKLDAQGHTELAELVRCLY